MGPLLDHGKSTGSHTLPSIYNTYGSEQGEGDRLGTRQIRRKTGILKEGTLEAVVLGDGEHRMAALIKLPIPMTLRCLLSPVEQPELTVNSHY